MTTPIIFFDESHNTGADLLEKNQPIFTLASVDFNQDECKELLSVFPPRQKDAEIKSKYILKDRKRELLKFFDSPILSERCVKSMIVHKRFNVVTQFIDIIEETLMRRDRIDIYKNSGNIVLANLHWYLTPHFCGEERFNEFLFCFVQMIRKQTNESKTNFFNTARKLYDNCIDEKHKSALAPYIYAERFIDDILDGIDKTLHIDPAISVLFCHLTEWGKQLNKPFVAIHDKSKPIKASLSTFEKLANNAIPSAIIGYGQRKFDFPLKVKELRAEEDSKQYLALQVADLIAGSTSYYYSEFFCNSSDSFFYELKSVGIERFVFSAICPQGIEYLQSESLKTNDSDINPADYMANTCQ